MEEILSSARIAEESGDWLRAIDYYLEIKESTTNNHDLLE